MHTNISSHAYDAGDRAFPACSRMCVLFTSSACKKIKNPNMQAVGYLQRKTPRNMWFKAHLHAKYLKSMMIEAQQGAASAFTAYRAISPRPNRCFTATSLGHLRTRWFGGKDSRSKSHNREQKCFGWNILGALPSHGPFGRAKPCFALDVRIHHFFKIKMHQNFWLGQTDPLMYRDRQQCAWKHPSSLPLLQYFDTFGLDSNTYDTFSTFTFRGQDRRYMFFLNLGVHTKCVQNGALVCFVSSSTFHFLCKTGAPVHHEYIHIKLQ